MPRREPDLGGDELELCEGCGDEIWRSMRARHRGSRRHVAAVARRKRERAVPERRDLVRVLVRLEWGSMPKGTFQGESSFAWRAIPRAAVPALASALHRALEHFAPGTVGLELGSELWGPSKEPAHRRAPPAPVTDQLPLDLTQPRRRRADTRACTTPASSSPGTRTSPSSWAHGGGFCPGVAKWRWRGRLVVVVRGGASLTAWPNVERTGAPTPSAPRCSSACGPARPPSAPSSASSRCRRRTSSTKRRAPTLKAKKRRR